LSDLLDGFKFYKHVQNSKYDKNDSKTKEKLRTFRKALGDFTDDIFTKQHSFIAFEKGQWQNSGNFTKYMWNRYKPQNDKSSLVIYFTASTKKNEGLFISIGLIDDKLTLFEENHRQEIYNFLENECKQINVEGFNRTNSGSGERTFLIVDESNYKNLAYDELIKKLKIVYDKAYSKFYKTPEESVLSKNKKFQALNQILYGPPGTGKTYNTINKALEIIDGIVPENRADAKQRFEELTQAGQIEFITFHQSYGYEEFVEGIKALPVGQEGNEDGNEMIYAVQNGIFKKIVKEAKLNFSTQQNKSNIIKRRFLLNAKSLNIQAEMIEDDSNTYRVLKGSKIRKGEADSFHRYNYSGLKEKVLNTAKYYEEDEFYLLEEDYIFQSMSAASSVVLGRQSNGYNDWKEIINDNLLSQKQNSLNSKNYILIIDEINRGNISKIFGELITLIEPSKRIGSDEEIRVRLPYSNDEFGVPSNLYILGTMNTADRSIALMDTALRRRFEFTEMLPRPELLDFKIEGIHIQSMLEKINQRVEYLYDRDHTIGHAYFMTLQENQTIHELENIFRNKIIPLLQEYFYDDWEKILMVLGDGFIERKEIKSDIFDYKQEDYLEDEKFIYTLKENFNFEKYKQ
jgi:5-methylcytosine-specific restriction enzyme B